MWQQVVEVVQDPVGVLCVRSGAGLGPKAVWGRFGAQSGLRPNGHPKSGLGRSRLQLTWQQVVEVVQDPVGVVCVRSGGGLSPNQFGVDLGPVWVPASLVPQQR